jgi:hypothetical protein
MKKFHRRPGWGEPRRVRSYHRTLAGIADALECQALSAHPVYEGWRVRARRSRREGWDRVPVGARVRERKPDDAFAAEVSGGARASCGKKSPSDR